MEEEQQPSQKPESTPPKGPTEDIVKKIFERESNLDQQPSIFDESPAEEPEQGPEAETVAEPEAEPQPEALPEPEVKPEIELGFESYSPPRQTESKPKPAGPVVEHVDPETEEIPEVKEPLWQRFLSKFKKRERHAVGIDLGSQTLKLAQLSVKNKHVELTELVKESLPEKILNNPFPDRKEYENFIKDVCARYGIKGKAYSSIPLDAQRIRFESLPPMPDTEIADALLMDIKREQKGSFDSISYDYILLEEDVRKEQDPVHAVIITAPKGDIVEHLEILKSSGLKVHAVEPDIFALLGSLEYNRNISEDEVVLVINLGWRRASFNVVVNNELRYHKALKISGDEMVEAVVDYCAVSPEEALDLLMSFSKNDFPLGTSASDEDVQSSAEQQDSVKTALLLLLEKLAGDIERTFKYFSFEVTKSRITNFDRIIMTGGLSTFSFMRAYIYERFQVDVDTDNPLKVLKVSEDSEINPEFMQNNAMEFSVAIGSALRDCE